jgi:radical SAM superfamily enzyme YgiQ (UPF0313 family)
MKILLVYANPFTLLWPAPAGLSLIARACREEGHEVRLLDLMFEKDPDTLLARALSEEAPDLVGLSLRNLDNADMEDTRSFVADYLRWVAMCREKAPVIVGGSAVTAAPEAMLAHTGATWAMAGQGERSIPVFLRELREGAPFTAAGLLWREDGTIRRNPMDLGGHARGLDWSFIDRKKYERPFMAHGLLTKSGCPHACAFCDAPNTAGHRFMPRPPEEIVEDLRREAADYKLNRREYMLIDPCFNQPVDWARAFCEAVIRSGLRVRFAAIVEPTPDLDEELCRLMVRAGNTMVTGLVGSCDDRVLAASRRPFDAGAIARAFDLFERTNLLYMPQFMFGGPEETLETVEVTARFMERRKPVMIQCGVGVRVYPQAPLRARAVAEGLVAEDDLLLEPRFYVAPGLDLAEVRKKARRIKPPLVASSLGWCRYMARTIL